MGEGILARWFDCAVGVQNTILRRQSLAFSLPYAEAEDELQFLTRKGVKMAEDASNVIVGVVTMSAASELELVAGSSCEGVVSNPKLCGFRPKAVRQYSNEGLLLRGTCVFVCLYVWICSRM